MERPLSPDQVKRLLAQILATGRLTYSGHALREMANDRLEITDVANVLRGGWSDPAELENGSWRYRIHTRALCVVVAILAEDHARVVTAWRKKR
jgi:hypothetical protein